MSPEQPTPAEQKAIDKMVEVDVDFATEQVHVHEVLAQDDEIEDTCD